MRKLGFAEGLATGLWLLAFVGAVGLGASSPSFAEMYRSMNPAVIKGITKLVLSPAWYVGTPVVMLGAMIAALVWRPRHAIIAVAVASIGIAIFWYFAAYDPIFGLAGNIR